MSHPYEEHPYLSSMIQLHSNTTILEMSSRMRTITEHPAIISDDMYLVSESVLSSNNMWCVFI